MRSPASMLTLAVLWCLAACSGAGTPAQVTHAANLYATETDAYFEGSLNHKASKPLATLELGSSVVVLSDTYGKDYWACRVRTEASQVGWVLCTSLNYGRSSGT